MKLALWGAAIDRQLINRLIDPCPGVEVSKYNYLGLLVILISLVSFLAVTYLFARIFGIEEISLYATAPSVLAAVAILSFCWLFIVFNILRLTISFFGFGDGSSAMSLGSLANKFFVIIMAIVLGMCIGISASAVLLNTGEDTLFILDGSDKAQSFNKEIDAKYRGSLDKTYFQLAELLLQKEAAAGTDLISLDSIKLSRSAKDEDVVDFYSDIDQFKAEISLKKQEKFLTINDDFFSSLQRVFEQNHGLVVLMMALGVLIHLTPIMVKLIWPKGPYEYLVDYQNRYVLARNGVVPGVFWHDRQLHEDHHFSDAERLLKKNRGKLDNELSAKSASTQVNIK
jgi:hypothetical protein